MFESTGEMVIFLVLLAVGVFPFVYLRLKSTKKDEEDRLQ